MNINEKLLMKYYWYFNWQDFYETGSSQPRNLETQQISVNFWSFLFLWNSETFKGITFKIGYGSHRDFWEVLDSLSDELKKKFLLFATGSDRVPVGGMGEMTFKITKVTNKPENLPEAHTCFNQLVLPSYENEDLLRQKLIIAISNAEGFGLE